MAEQLLPYALSTLQRVKDILFDPNDIIVLTGTTGLNSTTITAVSGAKIANVLVGQIISGVGIPAGTTVVANNTTSLVISQQATATGTVTLNVINQPSAFDAVLTREINAVTEFINQSVNRNFLLTKYISEVRTQFGKQQKYVMTKNAPVFYMTDLVSVVGGTNTFIITNPNGVAVGMPIFGDNILPNTTITVISGTTITVSNNFVATSTTNHIIITGLLNLMYRAGTPDNPQWQFFTTAQYELVNDAKSGVIRVLGQVASLYSNTAKLDYWAGYLINFANAGDNLTHTLPSEISRLCENIVVRWFKRRNQAGKTSQTLETSVITYDRLMDSQDIDIMNRYRRVPPLM